MLSRERLPCGESSQPCSPSPALLCSAPQYLPGVVATLALVMINSVRRDELLSYDSYDEGEPALCLCLCVARMRAAACRLAPPVPLLPCELPCKSLTCPCPCPVARSPRSPRPARRHVLPLPLLAAPGLRHQPVGHRRLRACHAAPRRRRVQHPAGLFCHSQLGSWGAAAVGAPALDGWERRCRAVRALVLRHIKRRARQACRHIPARLRSRPPPSHPPPSLPHHPIRSPAFWARPSCSLRAGQRARAAAPTTMPSKALLEAF